MKIRTPTTPRTPVVGTCASAVVPTFLETAVSSGSYRLGTIVWYIQDRYWAKPAVFCPLVSKLAAVMLVYRSALESRQRDYNGTSSQISLSH